jgi:hypothetical protein
MRCGTPSTLKVCSSTGTTAPLMMKGRPCCVRVPESSNGTRAVVDCNALPVVVWPGTVIGSAHGPKANEPLAETWTQ